MFRYGLYVAAIIAAAGCGIPHDPDGTFERVRAGTMRVGVSAREPWTGFEDGQANGIEADLVQEFARQIDAQVQWVPGAESELLEALHRGELDLVVGGLKSSTPWVDRVGLTRPYATNDGREHVMAVPLGENRWLLELQRFLNARGASVRRLAAEPAS